MKFDNSVDNLCVYLDNPMRINPHRISLTDFSKFSCLEREKLFKATALSQSGKAYRTQTRTFYCAVIPFGRFIADARIRFCPTTRREWQSILNDFQSHYLKNSESNATFASRCRMWDDPVQSWLRGLAAELVIPAGVKIPRCNLPAQVVEPDSITQPKLLGVVRAKYTPIREPINKTLAGPIFWHSEVEYLDDVEDTLRRRDCIVRGVLDDHWLRLIKDYRTGKTLMGRIPQAELDRRITDSDWKSHLVRPKTGRHAADQLQLTHPNVPNNLGWALVIAKNELDISDNAKCLSTESLLEHPAMVWSFLHKSKCTLRLAYYTALRVEQSNRISARLLFLRLLGILNNVDLAVAVAILIQEHPQFTPEALIGARLITSRGKAKLLVSDGGKSRIFSVDKPRAGSRKYALLSHRAARVMKHVVRATSGIRKMLKRSASKFWRHLFLGCAARPMMKVGLVQITSQQLNNRNRCSVATFYPELAREGIEESFDFAKLRATQGVLEWFATGSISKAARRLGNSYRVSMENYIPGPLLALWNERIIRNFQNVLIVLAASSEEYLLDVSDFQNLNELHAFLKRIVAEHPASVSPIGALIQKRFGKSQTMEIDSIVKDRSLLEPSLLTLRLDEHSMAVLMAFHRWAPTHLSLKELEMPESATGLPLSAFLDLAEFLNHAAESEDVGEALRESLTLSKLKHVHEGAQTRIPYLIERMATMRLCSTWEVAHV